MPPPLVTDNRAWLHERIAQRFDAMLAGGFIDEVTALRARGDLHPDLPSMRCVGYRQCWQALEIGRFDTLRDDVAHWSGWWKNRIARTLLNFMFVTLGTLIGEYAAGIHIIKNLL